MMDFSDSDLLRVTLRTVNIIFLLLVANTLRMIFIKRGKPKGKISPQARRVRNIFILGIVPLFLALFIYQATWQVAGFMRPGFINFMQRYDHRPLNPAHRQLRGCILDRNGDICAHGSISDSLQKRSYPFGAAACHIIGYANRSFGLSGVEQAENALLSGYSINSTDTLKKFGKNIVDRKQIEGSDVRLTIDVRLQQVASSLLRGKSGAIVIINPANGEILTMVSSPAFNPENISDKIINNTSDAPLLNRALHGLYPPGSTFKVVMAAAALEKKFDRKFACPPDGVSAAPGSRPIRDHEYYACKRRGRRWRGRGPISLEDALIHSSNVFFAQLGLELGAETFNHICEVFHFNKSFTVLNGASSKIVSSSSKLPHIKNSQKSSLAQVSIGQGKTLVTPLQMAYVVAVIGNDGIGCMPHLKFSSKPILSEIVISPDSARKVQAMMRGVVEKGTARGVKINGISIAAKTGTAQNSHGKDHSWFICLAPSPHPHLAIAVVVEHGGYGSQSALPIARKLVLFAAKSGYIHPVMEQ